MRPQAALILRDAAKPPLLGMKGTEPSSVTVPHLIGNPNLLQAILRESCIGAQHRALDMI
jgi:hypothetical protein